MMFIGVIMFYAGYISVKTTPGGDGRRIYPKALSETCMKEVFPLWNPYRGGGVPLLASSEHFGWVGRLIPMQGAPELRNFGINCLLVCSILAISFMCYCLAVELSLSKTASAITGFLFSSSYLVWEYFNTGRINAIVGYALILAALYCYIRFLKTTSKRSFIFSSVLISGAWYICVYYGIVVIALVFFLVGVSLNQVIKGNFFKSIFQTLLQNIILYLLSALFIMPLLLPMFDYSIASVVSSNGVQGYGKLHNYLPQIPGSFLSCFFLDDHAMNVTKSFPFISPLLIPLISVLTWSTKQADKDYKIWPWICLLFLNLAVLLNEAYPFSLMVAFFETMPLVRNIRWGFPFQFNLVLALCILAGMGYDLLSRNRIRFDRLSSFIPLTGAVFIICLSLGIDFVWAGFSFPKFISKSYVLNSGALGKWEFWLCVIMAVLPVGLLNIKYLATVFVGLIVISMIFFSPESKYPLSRRASNISDFKGSLLEHIKNDDSYYSMVQLHDLKNETRLQYVIGLPEKRFWNCMVYYFPDELRNVHCALFNIREKSLKVRPHWTRVPKVELWNYEAVNMMNIKYLITDAKSKHDPFLLQSPAWSLVETSAGLNLWRKTSWESGLRLFTDWEIIDNDKEILAKIRNSEYKFSNRVYIDRTVGKEFSPQKDNTGMGKLTLLELETQAHKLAIKIHAQTSGILFIPEIWDKYWQVEVDGKKRNLLRANGAFRAVAISDGTHLIEFRYELVPFYIGLAVCIVTAIVCLLWGLNSYRNKSSRLIFQPISNGRTGNSLFIL